MSQELSRRSFVTVAGASLAALAVAPAASVLASEAYDGQAQDASAQGDGQARSSQQSSIAENAGEMTVDDEGNRHVIDCGGTEVVCPAEVKTVMAFGSCGVICTLVETLGCGSLLANHMSPRFDSWTWQYECFAPQMADAPQYEDASGELDIEGIVAAAPDLCVVMQPATAQTLRDAGLTTLYVTFSGVSSDSGLPKTMTVLGNALGVPEKAEEYNAYFDEMVEKIEGVTAGIAEEDKVKVVYGNVTEFTNPHPLSEWFIPAAGGISCTADIQAEGQTKTYTAEDLLAWDPDVILMISDVSDELRANEQINSIKAIQNDRMYCVPTVGHFITGSSELPLGVLYVANKFYPDLYPAEELAEDVLYFYKTFFGYEMNEEEIDSIVNYAG